MGRMSALESNGLKYRSKEYSMLEEKMLKLETVINNCIRTGKVTAAKQKKIIELLEALSDINFDIGKVDNLELLEYLKQPDGRFSIYQIIKYSQGEINPKNYGYNKIRLKE